MRARLSIIAACPTTRFDIGLAHGVELAPLVVEEQQFQELKQRERLIARDIEREGIPL
jgi:hypothetical protein